MLRVRSKYIDAFRQVIREMRESGRDVTPEVRIEINTPASQELYRLLVVDLLEKKQDGTVGVIEMNCGEIDAVYRGLDIVGPVAWNGLNVRCDSTVFREADLLAWGNRWIHDESPPLGPQDGLTGVIHSVTQPEEVRGATEFSVDLGSAPFQAFEELLSCLSGCIESVGSSFSEDET